MADKIVQLKDKDDNNIYPLSHIMDDYILWNEREGGDIGEYILWEEDTGGTTSPLEYAPVESTFVSNEDDPSNTFINPDNAIFNFKTSNNQLRARDQRQFLVTFTNPIDGYNFYGTCETTEIVNFYGSGGNVEIWQVATDVTTSNIVFKRKGEITSVVDVTNLTSQSITWKPWYPIEYPCTIVPISNSGVATDSNVRWAVVGGVMIFTFDSIKYTATSTVGLQIATISMKDISQWLKHDKGAGGAFRTTGVISNHQSAKTDIISINTTTSTADTLTLTTWGREANVDYFGSISVPLGY